MVLAAFGRKVRDFKKEEKGLIFLAQRETSVDALLPMCLSDICIIEAWQEQISVLLFPYRNATISF